MNMLQIIQGDALSELTKLPDESVNCCVTSPPYWGLRDYQHKSQVGLEKKPDDYVGKMVNVFREVRRVLRKDGVCFLNLGDTYAGGGKNQGSTIEKLTSKQASNRGCVYHRIKVPLGLKPKDLCGIPWRVAFALQADGWYLRQDIIWHKPNPMPESVTDRCTKAHEYIFLLTKSAKYWWDQKAVRQRVAREWDESNGGNLAPERIAKAHGEFRVRGGEYPECNGYANRKSVWSIATRPYPESHFATFPEELPKLCILAGCPCGGTVLDPFAGSGTVGKVALELGRKALLIELNPDYIEMIKTRTNVTHGML